MSTTLATRPRPAAPSAAGGPATVRWVLGAMALGLGGLVLAVGVLFVVVDQTQRDAHGYLMNPANDLQTRTAALVASEPQAVGDDGLRYDVTGDAQLTVRSTRDVFVGIAPASAAERYLDGVATERIDDLADTSGTTTRGHAATAPAAQPIWAASVSGRGDQTLRWKASDGDWRVVVLNADGSPGVRATVAVGARHPSSISLQTGLGLLGGAAVLLLAGVAILPLRRPGRRATDEVS